MICYICEKEIKTDNPDQQEFIYFAYASTERIKYAITDDVKGWDKYPGFHIECLKDSLGEDFYRFFREEQKK